MCGICGIVQSRPSALGKTVRRMNDAQAHRGPDGEGFYIGGPEPELKHRYDPALEKAGICALGHRRLAILDPLRGAQPIATSDGRFVALLNGEIYNFRALRDELEAKGHAFRTDSDTEVLLYLCREHPDAPAAWLGRLNGIFSIALWDARQKRLLLARDPYGVKPLHYCSQEDRFLFASEIKAILAGGVKARLNRSALHVFMNVRYVPGRETLFRDVYRLPPAHYAVVENGAVRELAPYYRLPSEQTKSAGLAHVQLKEEINRHFHQAVERQLLSDVPVGMTLSGGLDSSMIVAAAASAYKDSRGIRTADRTLRTFTLGFNEPTDENEDARAVAEHFGAEHHDTRLTADPLAGMADVIRAVEEPKVNMTQGYELARFVRPHVKVIFGGLGGDELFAGYDIHRYCNTFGRFHRAAPEFVQQHLLSMARKQVWRMQHRSGARKHDVHRIGAQILLSMGDRTQFYCRLRNAWDYDAGMYESLYARPDAFKACPSTDTYFRPYFESGGAFLDQVLRAEFQTKMVDDFLVNEDRVTSAHGVEGRVPFLDRDLVELMFGVPGRLKMRGWETKSLWKECVSGAVPARVLQKKKHGFTFSSYHQWQKDLKGKVEQELTPEWCRDTRLFNYKFVQSVLNYEPHPNLRWHYFVAWMMLGVKVWMNVFDVQDVDG